MNKSVGAAITRSAQPHEIVDQAFVGLVTAPHDEAVFRAVNRLEVPDRQIVLCAAKRMGADIPRQYGRVHLPSVGVVAEELRYIPPTLPTLLLAAEELGGLEHKGAKVGKATEPPLKVAGSLAALAGAAIGRVAERTGHPRIGKMARGTGSALSLPREAVHNAVEGAALKLQLVGVARHVVANEFGKEYGVSTAFALAPYISAIALERLVSCPSMPEELCGRFAKKVFLGQFEASAKKHIYPRPLSGIYQAMRHGVNPDIIAIVEDFSKRRAKGPKPAPSLEDLHGRHKEAEYRQKSLKLFSDLEIAPEAATRVFDKWEEECGLGPAVGSGMLTAAYRALADRALLPGKGQRDAQLLLGRIQAGAGKKYVDLRRDIRQAAEQELQRGKLSAGSARVIADIMSEDYAVAKLSIRLPSGLKSRGVTNLQLKLMDAIDKLAVRRFGLDKEKGAEATYVRANWKFRSALREAFLADLVRQEMHREARYVIGDPQVFYARSKLAANRFMRSIQDERSRTALPLDKMVDTLKWAKLHGDKPLWESLDINLTELESRSVK